MWLQCIDVDQSLLHLETADLQARDVLKTKLNEVNTVNFWAKFVPDTQCHASKKLAVSVLTMFGLTYSTMNAIKSKHRSVITECNVYCTDWLFTNYTSIMKSRKQFHTLH